MAVTRNKVLFFYNPNAGNGLFKSNLDYIIERFQLKGLFVVPVRIGRTNMLDKVMAQIDEKEYRQIIAAGGDGTLNACINSMIKHDIHLPLGIFPSGTSNDFAHHLEIPREIKEMTSIALGSRKTCSDVGMVNDRAFINVSAMGNLVDVSQRTDPTWKNTLGVFAYYMKGLSELSVFKPFPVSIKSKEVDFEGDIYFMLAMNGVSAGGFRNLSPDAEINDGKLAVTIFKKMPPTELVPLVINYLQGNHQRNKNVIHFKTEEMFVDSTKDIGTDVDGETGEKPPLHFTILKSRLLIYTLLNDMKN
ncbi:MAG: YegS/Rv2252/BmrU family lipid kinase [Anaerovoracaceae bacterium]|nr:YegS/Rv2252/BmrU family lipid kinase [Clostridiales bacterium]